MRNKEKDAEQMASKRKHFLEKAYELFTTKNIESVSMTEIAKACGYGTMTLYRYFNTDMGAGHHRQSGAQTKPVFQHHDRG